MGGRSKEHEISLKTGKFMYNTLDRSRYQVKPILITQEGVAYIPKEWNLDWKYSQPNNFIEEFLNNFDSNPMDYWKDPSFGGCDVILLGLHGGEGEDGRIQSLFEISGIAFTGSPSFASFLAMDKFSANLIFQNHGLNVPDFFLITKEEFFTWKNQKSLNQNDVEKIKKKNFSFPLFTKPRYGGSSVNTFPAFNFKEWIEKVEVAFEQESCLLVQKCIQGREVSCGVIEIKKNEEWHTIPLPPTEIQPQSEFFDYESKYKLGASKEITPPNMPTSWIQAIQDSSLTAHFILGCKGYSRTDFIVTEDGIPWILETNTLPGMTETSLLPQQAQKAGYSMQDILNNLILLAWERKQTLNLKE